MRKAAHRLITGLILSALPVVAQAQSAQQVRDEAQAGLARMLRQGEPRDRCSIGAFVDEGRIVTRVFSRTPLQPGDRIMRFGSTDVSARTMQELLALVRHTPPGARVPVTVERNGRTARLDLVCANAKPASEAWMSALKLAAAGKFDDCVAALGRTSGLGTYAAVFKAECASAAANPSPHAVAEYMHAALKMLVEDATYAPAMREDVRGRLQASGPIITRTLGPARFAELVNLARTWRVRDRQPHL